MLTDLNCRQAKGSDKSYKLGDSRGLYLYVTPRGIARGDGSTGLAARKNGWCLAPIPSFH